MWPSTNVIFQVCGLIKCFIDQPWMIHLSIYVIVLMIISTRKTPYCLIVCIQTLPRATQGAANRGTNGNCFPNETFQECFKIVKKTSTFVGWICPNMCSTNYRRNFSASRELALVDLVGRSTLSRSLHQLSVWPAVKAFCSACATRDCF